jgi:cytosine permease
MAAPLTPEPTALVDWTKGIAPRYIALFLVVVFSDQLAVHTLAVGGLLPSLLGAIVASLLCYFLLFRPLALSGLEARRPIEDVGASTFGTLGAKWLLCGVLALAHVLWFSIALYHATEIVLRGLSAHGLIADRHLAPVTWQGLQVSSPLVLWVALAWSLASALIGTLTVRLVSAVMAGYQPFVAAALALGLLWALPGAPAFLPLGFDPISLHRPESPPRAALLSMVQLIFAFFATQGVLGIDWGRVSRDRRDLQAGGWVGIVAAAPIIAAIALLIVAGANGKAAQAHAAPPSVAHPLSPGAGADSAPDDWRRFTVVSVLQYGLGGAAGGTLLIVLSLGLLGPACYTPHLIARFGGTLHDGPPRWCWSLLGAIATWPLLAFRAPARLDLMFDTLGALGAPLAGAICADRLRRRGAWQGARPGLNMAGAIAWVAGFVAGALPLLAPRLGLPAVREFILPSVLAYVVALGVYWLCCAFGLEPRPVLAPAEATASPIAVVDP